MAEFINTRDEIGDQETVDGLVDHSLTALKEDGVTEFPTRSIASNPTITYLEFPNVTRIAESAFVSNTKLETVILGGHGSTSNLVIGQQAFRLCSKLKHLVIDRPVAANINSETIVSNTRIENRLGYIYVPSGLIETYRNNSYIKRLLIVDLNKYPITSPTVETIDDSWNAILSNVSYSTDYRVGDVKALTLTNGTTIRVGIAAFDTDNKSDETGKAKITWVTEQLYFNMANDSYNWSNCSVRTWANDTLYNLFPSEIKEHIVSVKKITATSSATPPTLTETDDFVWVPSFKECCNSRETGDNTFSYSNYFYATNKRVNENGNADVWNTRSMSNKGQYCAFSNVGGGIYTGSLSSVSYLFGFCTD